MRSRDVDASDLLQRLAMTARRVRRIALRARLVTLVTLVLASACGDERPASAPTPVRVAAASSVTSAFEEIGRAFQARTGTPVRFVFGASGSLAQQLDAGAPFDVLAAADEASVARVVESGACDRSTAGEYARGRLVVWTREGVAPPQTLAELADPRFARVALANPEHAPYGSAAREALRRAGLWSTVEPRVVYAENIRQALQFAETGNVDVAFVAQSLVIDEARPHLLVDESMHAPIVQSLVVCRRGARREDGRAFAEFVRSAEGVAILRRFGFAVVSGSEPATGTTETETETETATETETEIETENETETETENETETERATGRTETRAVSP
jgi:molybdate transport system substrate-binding protein